jgi:hypothetical protein
MSILTDDLSFQLGDTGVLLNADDTTLPFVDVTQVIGLDSAPFRTAQRDHEGTDGDFIDAEFESGRDLLLSGTIYADPDNMESYLDSLLVNYAPSRTLVPFYFKAPGVNERLLMVKPLGIKYDWDMLRRTGAAAFQIAMHAEDPRKYSSNLNTQTMLSGSTIVTGRAYNKSYNYGYGSIITVPDTVIVTNGGNREAPAIITINGPVQLPTIVNDTAGKTLQFNITMTNTDVLVIDLLNHSVILNGSVSRRGTLVNPDWFLLAKGDNLLHYQSASAPSSSSATITWRDAWR